MGPTFACLLGITFANIRDGDRFYFKVPGIFNPEQVASIEQHSLAAIICDNSDSITELQQDVFLSDQPRVLCSDIPMINLELWAMCHFRVDVGPISRTVLFDFMSSVSGESNFQNYPETFELNSETVSRCVSVLCPDSSGSVLVAFSPAIVNGDMTDFIEFSVETNPALPANTASSGAESVYHATWTETDFDNSGTGV